jgi:hypothetical protein
LDYCPDCGAYWQCEHRPAGGQAGFYVAPDSASWAALHGEPLEDAAAHAKPLLFGLSFDSSNFNEAMARVADALSHLSAQIQKLSEEIGVAVAKAKLPFGPWRPALYSFGRKPARPAKRCALFAHERARIRSPPQLVISEIVRRKPR